MDYRAVFRIAAAGMDFERSRLDAAALNLANMHSTRPAGQPVFAAQRVIALPLPAEFGQCWASAGACPGLRVISRRTESAPARLVYDPGHPHADGRGFVSYPSIDHALEMVTVSTALRAYEANVAVASAARAMVAKAVDIGGQ